jgi:hypothetical protein
VKTYAKMNKIKNQTLKMKGKSAFFKTFIFLSLMGLVVLLTSQTADTLVAEPADPVPLIDTTVTDEDMLEAVEEIARHSDAIADVPLFIKGRYTTQEIRRGERLFKGLIPFSSGTHDCSSCHYYNAQQEINWNPSAHDLAEVWSENPDYNIIDFMNNPFSARLLEDHAGMTITALENHLLEAYYSTLVDQGKPRLYASPMRAAIFWGVGFLMLLAIIDLVFTRKIPFKFIHIIILFTGIGIHGQIAMAEAQALGRTPGFAPDQPIKFSHLIHAGENQIDCRYCHFTADYSISANIPSNNVCMNCHNVILNGTNSGSFEINKIHRAAASGRPVEWIRIHKLPDHSFFSHAQHANVARLDCSECHGAVEEMHILRQVEDLSMGWCLRCHRSTNVDFTDNPYYENYYEHIHELIRSGEIDGITSARLGGEDCMKCHY